MCSTSLTATGTPASGGAGEPEASVRSSARARSSARSASTARNASTAGSIAAIRSRCVRATSSQETSRAATRRRSSTAVASKGEAHPITRGTRKRPSAASGASARARSRGRPSPADPRARCRGVRVAHRGDVGDVEGLQRLRPGQDLVELPGEELASRRRSGSAARGGRRGPRSRWLPGHAPLLYTASPTAAPRRRNGAVPDLRAPVAGDVRGPLPELRRRGRGRRPGHRRCLPAPARRRRSLGLSGAGADGARRTPWDERERIGLLAALIETTRQVLTGPTASSARCRSRAASARRSSTA